MTESRLPQDPATNNRSRTLAFPVDQIGVWTSTLCVVHCLLTPVVLSLSAVSAHFLPSEEKTHRTLAVAIAALGAIALVKGYRRHRSWRVLALMAVGLAFIFGGAFWGDHLASHGVEVLVTLIGSGFMIAAHRTNHTFCRDCSCSHSD
ncbi:MerC domain-containing protein [Tunturibacter empetritectus]|uniref:Peptidoglycan/LPS O-acetylase OafA/YrhL n=1 Tax=Tunturiibacter empetritectus TaxID=3069691 RepID=A0A7W8MRC1_9BACT|nr:MerC domain-containing protein [Edaphobacter lichenicola]MBB5316645.1 peptidoglycan/LPS O-acetylase OafA/YrhL [Edaphobacter lichenicola]